MIEVRDLVKTFDGFAALRGATLTVPKGAVYGLVGPNGAGKSTLLRHITGVFRQDSGEVLVNGVPVYENRHVKENIVSIPDDWFYYNQSTIREMACFAASNRLGFISCAIMEFDTSNAIINSTPSFFTCCNFDPN